MDIPISHAAVDRVTEYKLNDYPILTIGRFSYLDGRALIYFYDELSRVRVGNFSSVATNAAFFLRANHHPEWVTVFPLPVMPWPADVARPIAPHANLKGDIEIGSDVWVGVGAYFMPGVNVGDGAVIGAGTVVTKNVPPYALFAGNPGQVRKMRFEERDIEFLLRLKWWDWPTEKIRRFAPLICSTEIDKLRAVTEG